MIRFIDLRNQINEWENHFAFFDTVCDDFVKIYDEFVWTSWDECAEALRLDNASEALISRLHGLAANRVGHLRVPPFTISE